MSNRTIEQSNFAAELRASHLAQIEALIAPGLSDCERVERFAAAAEFSEYQLCYSLSYLFNCGPAKAAWVVGDAERSLFANLPGCMCPVHECLSGVPQHTVPAEWHPNVVELERFSEIQIERRCN